MAFKQWIEDYASEMPNFLNESSFYLGPLAAITGIETPFRNIEDCSNGYTQVAKCIRKKSIDLETKDKLMCCFGLAMAKFIIESYTVDWSIKRKVLYNSYVVPILSIKEGKQVDPISIARIYLKRGSVSNFKMLYWGLTDVTPLEFDTLFNLQTESPLR
ncbi:hypothetical protein [Hymenobacter sp. 102]|uniref:hypothetical protein n=1 Tax=Hymenobacter sp. 102 TaxID=3403152 RepID=UPI003CED8453